MIKRGLSLRYKILLLLTALPVVTLGAYLVLALRIFESDKIAYVFDATSNMAGSVAGQVRTQLNSILVTCKPLLQDYASTIGTNEKPHFSAVGDKELAGEPTIEAVAAYRQLPAGGFEQMAVLQRQPDVFNRAIAPIQGDIAADFTSALKQGRLLRVLDDDRVLLMEKFEHQAEITLFVVITRLPEIAQMFHNSSAEKLYLIDRAGKILFAPDGEGEGLLQDQLKLSFLNSGLSAVPQGAETAKDAKGRAILASYSKLGYADLIVVATVAREKALSAVAVLMRKSIIFFVVLICFTIIISLFASGNLTQALSSLFQATQKVSEGQFDFRVEVKSSDEVGALAENFNVMAAEVSRLMLQTAEKARMESELQTAKTVQETLFPKTEARLAGLEIAGFYEPASECGGDWWHYCESDGKVYLWIGDATGHGAPAALITSAAKSAATIIETMQVSPAVAMGYLNKAICEVSRGRIMMTFFLACFDPRTRTLSYANASHEAPFLIRKGDGPLKKKDLVPLNDVNNPRLGQDKDTVYQQTTIPFEPDEMIFFYTDGVPDIRSADGADAWGEREFVKTIVKTNTDFPSAEDSVARFVGTFQAFRQGSQLVDDVTFFIVKNESIKGGETWENSTSNPKKAATA